MKAKKIIIPMAVIVGIAVIGGGVIALGKAASDVRPTDVVMIQQKTLSDKISVSGTIESSDRKNVYAKLNYPVETVNVSVGDLVKEGDVLCTISTEELQQQILQQQASVDSSGVNSEYTLSEAEKRYTDALEQYRNGENSLVANAAKAVEQAEKALEEAERQESLGKDTTLPINVQNADASVVNAKMNYDNAVKAYEDAEASLDPENYPADIKALYDELNDAKDRLNKVKKNKTIKELNDAKKKLDDAEAKYNEISAYAEFLDKKETDKAAAEYNSAKADYEAIAQKYDERTLGSQIKSQETQLASAIESLEKNRDNAKINMDNAKLAYDNAVSGYDGVIKQNKDAEENYGIAVKNAKDALKAAQDDYDLAVRQAEAEIASLKKAAEQQRTVSGLNDPQVIILQELKEKLDNAVVTAPCSGMVTAVNAEEGAAAAGIMFTIENVDKLKVTALVGEYDIPSVKEGMDAVIKCDALGDDEFDGVITYVSKIPDHSAMQSGVNYVIEASVNADDERLLTGMSAKLNIISEEKADALTVTYDVLAADENGGDAVYIAEKGEDGVYRARLVTVEIGLETDYEIEIISDELKDGMYVIADPVTVTDGSEIMINDPEAQE